MGRRLIGTEEQAQLAFDAVLAPLKPKKKASIEARSAKAFDRVAFEVEEMFETNRFVGADERHLAALHAVCHSHVYGVRDEVFEEREYLAAVSAAGRLLRDDFAGQVDKAVLFVRWAWKREKDREQVRVAKGKADGWRMGWRLVYGQSSAARALLNDFVLAMKRRGGNAATLPQFTPR